jgi:hypothetical protein
LLEITKVLVLHLISCFKLFLSMTLLDHPPTLQALLGAYSSPAELAEAIDNALLYMVLFLRYEPECLEAISESYEILYELKNAILHSHE